MPAPTGTGTLHQTGNGIGAAHLPQRIHLLHPETIRVPKVQGFGALFVVVKVKHQKSAASVGKQRIDPNHIRPIRLLSPQMGYDLLRFQGFPFPIGAVLAPDLFPNFLRAETVLPQILTLGIILCLPGGFVHTSLAVNIHPTPEVGIKPPCKLPGDLHRSGFRLAYIRNPRFLQKSLQVSVFLLERLYLGAKPLDFVIHRRSSPELRFVQVLTDSGYFHCSIKFRECLRHFISRL